MGKEEEARRLFHGKKESRVTDRSRSSFGSREKDLFSLGSSGRGKAIRGQQDKHTHVYT